MQEPGRCSVIGGTDSAMPLSAFRPFFGPRASTDGDVEYLVRILSSAPYKSINQVLHQQTKKTVNEYTRRHNRQNGPASWFWSQNSRSTSNLFIPVHSPHLAVGLLPRLGREEKGEGVQSTRPLLGLFFQTQRSACLLGQQRHKTS